jgi:hypothetical protein
MRFSKKKKRLNLRATFLALGMPISRKVAIKLRGCLGSEKHGLKIQAILCRVLKPIFSSK